LVLTVAPCSLSDSMFSPSSGGQIRCFDRTAWQKMSNRSPQSQAVMAIHWRPPELVICGHPNARRNPHLFFCAHICTPQRRVALMHGTAKWVYTRLPLAASSPCSFRDSLVRRTLSLFWPELKPIHSDHSMSQRMNSNDSAYARRFARLAYRYWEMRGSPVGSSDEDWFRAEREIVHECEPYGVLSFGNPEDRAATVG
jgi:hypothetical protein